MSIQLRDGSTVEDRRFDRIPEYDERSLNFPVAPLLSAAPPTTKLWTLPDADANNVLDQGQEGACTGFGTTNELRFNPVPVPGLTNQFAREVIYWGAQRIDPWPGGSYPGADPQYEGSSVLAAVKTAAKLGYYGAYHWALSEPDLARGLSQIGPGILGLTWKSNMSKPNRNGFIRYTGDNVGGHCILCIGIDVEHGFYTLYNSWGPKWGLKGTCKISRTDMAVALKKANHGEACIVTERFNPTAK